MCTYFIDTVARAGGDHRGYSNGIRASGHQRISISYYTIRLGFILVGSWIRIAISYIRQTSFWQGKSNAICYFCYCVVVDVAIADVALIIIVWIIIIIIIVLIAGFITLISSIKIKWFSSKCIVRISAGSDNHFEHTFSLNDSNGCYSTIIKLGISICSQLNAKYVVISTQRMFPLLIYSVYLKWARDGNKNHRNKSKRNKRKYSAKTKISGLLIDKSNSMTQLLYHHHHHHCRFHCSCFNFFSVRQSTPTYICSNKTTPTTINYGNQSSIVSAMPSWKPDLFILPLVECHNRSAYEVWEKETTRGPKL